MAALLCTALGKLLTSLKFSVLIYKREENLGGVEKAGSMGPGISRFSNKDGEQINELKI